MTMGQGDQEWAGFNMAWQGWLEANRDLLEMARRGGVASAGDMSAGDAWKAGPCLYLALGLERALGAPWETYCLKDGWGQFLHLVVADGRLYLDGGGLHTRSELEAEWEGSELRRAEIEDYADSDHGYRPDERVVECIAARWRQTGIGMPTGQNIGGVKSRQRALKERIVRA